MRWSDWRRKLGSGKLAVPASAMSEAPFAALLVETPPPAITAPGPKPAGRIELVVDGVSIRIGADVDGGLQKPWVGHARVSLVHPLDPDAVVQSSPKS